MADFGDGVTVKPDGANPQTGKGTGQNTTDSQDRGGCHLIVMTQPAPLPDPNVSDFEEVRFSEE